MYLFDQSKNNENNTEVSFTIKGLLVFALIVLFTNMITYTILFKKDINILKEKSITIEGYTGDMWRVQQEEQQNPLIKETEYTSKHLIPSKYIGTCRLTFYTPHELGASAANALRTATRTIPKEGRTIAVDPKIIPKNSLVYIEGWGYYIAEDTGSAIKGKRIDIFLNSYKMAKQLGNKQQARVYILQRGTI